MTIFEVDRSKGDVVAIVTANNGELSKVKFDTDAFSTPSILLKVPLPQILLLAQLL